jgi:hypothetical protein
MSYLQQIAQRNSLTGNTAGLLRPQPVHPFATGQGTTDGITEAIAMNNPAPSSDTVNILQPVQHTTLFTQAPTGTTHAEKPVQPGNKKQAAYIRSQLERTAMLQPVITKQQVVITPTDTNKHSNHEAKEATPATKWQSMEPVIPPALSPLINNKAATPEQMARQTIVPVTTEEKSIPVVKQLMPVAALQEPLPQKITTPNKLVIGKITVEIVQPVQPAVKTRERIITRIVHTGAGNGNSGGRNKLSFGLGQL